MSSLRDHQNQRKRAKDWLLRHPHATLREAHAALNAEAPISDRTVAQARVELVDAGLLKSGRNRKPKVVSAPPPPHDVPSEGAPVPAPDGDRLLTDDQLLALQKADAFDELDSLDDEETRRRLLREVKKLAFAPDTHPDTRLSATQVWLKLKDMARAKELGPGKPLTRAAAVARLTDLNKAITDLRVCVEAIIAAYGIQPVVQCLYSILDIKEPSDARTSEEAVDDGDSPPAPAVPSVPPLDNPQAPSQA